MPDESIETLRPLIRQCANERERAAFARIDELLTSPETDRERRRREYVREKAPIVLAALARQNPHTADHPAGWDEYTWANLRKVAIREAGMLFDETEGGGREKP